MEKATVQSIDRALSIIETLAGEKEGLGVTEISTRVGLHKSTVHRLLSALGERGYVEQRSGGAYRLGMKIVELSSLYLNQVELKTEAQPYLRRLLQLTSSRCTWRCWTGWRSSTSTRSRPSTPSACIRRSAGGRRRCARRRARRCCRACRTRSCARRSAPPSFRPTPRAPSRTRRRSSRRSGSRASAGWSRDDQEHRAGHPLHRGAHLRLSRQHHRGGVHLGPQADHHPGQG